MTESSINDNSINLPSGWVRVKLGEICKRITKGSTPTSYGYSYKTEGIKFVRAENIDENGNIFLISYFIDNETNQFLKRSILKENDLLFSIAGTIGRVGIVRKIDIPANTNQALAIIRTSPGAIDTKFLFYFLKSEEIQKHALKAIVGVGRANLSLTNIGEFAVSIAPLAEQKRIVEKIEKQFSRLDEAVTALKRIKANLKRYKASVLKAAVEGKLTEEWRNQHPDVEPACELLKRILTERRRKWEDEFPGKKYKEPTGPVIKDLPPIPRNWTCATLPQLGELNRGKSKHRPRNDPILYGGPYPFIQTGDIRHSNGVITDHSQTYSEKGLKQSRIWPKGTLCITIAANIADTAILGFDACFPDSVVGFIPNTDYTEVHFIEYFLRTEKEDIERFAPATAQKNINLAILGNVAIPIPPFDEQRVMMINIEERLSVAEKIETDVDLNLKRAERLRQSILKKAFSGKLNRLRS